MMGHRERLKGGDEWDALTRNWRSVLHWKPGQTRKAKRTFNKRVRRLARMASSAEYNQSVDDADWQAECACRWDGQLRGSSGGKSSGLSSPKDGGSNPSPAGTTGSVTGASDDDLREQVREVWQLRYIRALDGV